MTDKPKNPGGRPTIYTEELAERICDTVATHTEGTTTLCSKYDWMPDEHTIRMWRRKYTTFSLRYLDSKAQQAELLAESIDDIIKEVSYYTDHEGNNRIDPPSASLAIAKATNRKWTAARLAPKIYGDQKRVEELQGENERVKEELRALRDKLDKANVSEY